MAETIEQLLEQVGALRRGHFALSSGRHSDRYCQCAALLEHPRLAERAAKMLIDRLPESHRRADVVLAPALGGVLWGYEVARALGVRSIFAEREPGGPFALRRGFALTAGERVLLAEDVVTTGGSVMELVPLVERAGGVVAGFAAIADRSRGAFRPPAGLTALAELNFETYEPSECPLCRAGLAVDKPGSRRAVM